MKNAIVLVGLSLCCLQSMAVERNDFAYGYQLEVDGDGAIYSLTLPEDVYRGITRADRGDLRVFNSRGETVPHIIRTHERKVVTTVQESDVPMFPLYIGAEEKTAGQAIKNIKITSDQRGAVIDINYGKVSSATGKLVGYLLDASALTSIPSALRIEWDTQQTDFVLGVRLEGSDDLAQWKTVVANATLSNLHYGAHQLIQQQLVLPGRQFKYLRLTWEKNVAVNFSRVMALFSQTVTDQPRHYSEFVSDNGVKNQQGQMEYRLDLQSLLPVDRVSVLLPQRNTVLRVALESSSNGQSPWTSHYSGVVYDLMIEGEHLTSPEWSIPVTTHRYWRLRRLDQEGTLHGTPRLKLGWVSEQLLFVAQGEAPFTLAFGSARIKPADSSLNEFLYAQTSGNNGRLIKAAQLGPRIELGDVSLLQPPAPPVPWKKWILWAVLLIGVGLLAIMAIRLMKQMNGGSGNSPPPTAAA